MFLGLPRLEVNLFKATIEQPVLKSPANSQCIVLYVRHAKTTPYLFFVPMLCLLIYKHTLNTSVKLIYMILSSTFLWSRKLYDLGHNDSCTYE